MSILESKTRVTFVTEKETHNQIQELVKLEKESGRKMTVSKYIDEILIEHIESRKFFQTR